MVEGQQEVTHLEAIIELSRRDSFDQSPVTVKIKEVIEQDVLAVPTAKFLHWQKAATQWKWLNLMGQPH